MSIDPRTATVEELLQALTVGEVMPEEPLVAARLAQDPSLQARWRALATTLASLRDLDAGMHGDGGLAIPPVDATNTVRAFRRRTTSRTWGAVAAIAAAVLLMLWLFRSVPRSVPNPPLGGGATIGELSPDRGQWGADAPLRWQGEPRAAGYRLYVESRRDGTTVVLPDGDRGELLDKNQWLPSATDRAALPVEFRWRVVAFDASDQPIARSEWATTWRR